MADFFDERTEYDDLEEFDPYDSDIEEDSGKKHPKNYHKIQRIRNSYPCADYLIDKFFPLFAESGIRIHVSYEVQVQLMNSDNPKGLPKEILSYLEQNPKVEKKLINQMKMAYYEGIDTEEFIGDFWKVLDVFAGFMQIAIYEFPGKNNFRRNAENHFQDAREEDYKGLNEEVFESLLKKYKTYFEKRGKMKISDKEFRQVVSLNSYNVPPEFSLNSNRLIYKQLVFDKKRVSEILLTYLSKYVEIVSLEEIRRNPPTSLLTVKEGNGNYPYEIYEKAVAYFRNQFEDNGGKKVKINNATYKRIRRFQLPKIYRNSKVVVTPNGYLVFKGSVIDRLEAGKELLAMISDYVDFSHLES